MTHSTIDILLVDDEPRNLDALEVILADPAYRLLRAGGADEALRQLLEHDVAAIVLDIRMPGVSGLELAQIIKGTKRFRQIPIVFLTAHMMQDEDVMEGYGAGAVDYLTKPLKPEILRQKIAAFAELFRKTRALAELNETLEARVQERTAELERSEAALRASARQKDEFLATLAHELRNPLAPLRMGLDLLLRAQPPLSDYSRTLSVMNRQLEHMVRLIDDLLDVARISSGVFDLKKETTDLLSVVQTSIETCRPFLEQRRQTVSVVAASSVFAVVDPTRVVQMVGNLLHNASKFTPADREIRVELGLERGSAFIRVVDPGAGIAPDDLARVFEMFARIERNGVVTGGGLGIGLALSRRLAQMHGGELTASSEGVGRGSTFTLSLPACADPTDVNGPVVGTPPPDMAQAALDVIIVEDNEDAAELLSVWLGDRGYRAHVAHNGLDCLALVEQLRPWVILCDIGLPDIDGLEVCRRVRGLSLGYSPFIVALTGWGMTEDRRRTEAAGFDHHLVKPVAPELLFELLSGWSRGDSQADAPPSPAALEPP